MKAAGFNNQREMYKKVWNDLKQSMIPSEENVNFKYQNINYDMNEYGPMILKVNGNAYGKAGAYDFIDYKVEGNTVYLSLIAPTIDTYQYTVKATYKPNYKTFFEPLAQMNATSKNTAEKGFSKFIFYLASVDFKSDGYVDLQGMDYLAKEKQYLAIQVDDSGKVSIDNDNLLNLLRIKMDVANKKNMVKFNTTKI